MDNIHPSQFTRKAAEFGLDPLEMLRCRYRYLYSRVSEFKTLYLFYRVIDPYFWWWIEAAQDLKEVVDYANRYKRKPAGNGITDDMIQAAKQYPINQIVEFMRGKARAFCHDDKVPSAFHGTRNNTLECPVCDKHFDPVSVLMMRDGMSFPAAVRFLQ